MNNTTGVSSGAGSARLSSTLEFTLYCQCTSCCLMFRSLNRASFSVLFYLVIILSVRYMCGSGIDLLLYVFPIDFETVFCCFLFVILLIFSTAPSMSPGCIV